MDAILKVKRLASPIKLIGMAFLAFHCATTDVRFNPIWILVYVAVAFTIANAFVAIEFLIKFLMRRFHPLKEKGPNNASFTAEEYRCIRQISGLAQNLRAKPWKFVLIAGEDGFCFLPLLYVGITVPAVIVASAFFSAMHYRDKPLSALAGIFLFSAVNVWIVLPHGILPMVLGHFILDASAFMVMSALIKRVKDDQPKKVIP